MHTRAGARPALRRPRQPARARRGARRRRRPGRRWVLGGDYALLRRLAGGDRRSGCRRSTHAVWIRGNGERWTARPGDAPDNPDVPDAIAACREALGAELVDELGALPETAARANALLPRRARRSDMRSFLPEPAEDEAELLDGVRRAAARVRPHASAVPPRRGRRRRSSWSTRAASGCRSTATRAPATRSCARRRVEHRRVATTTPRRRRGCASAGPARLGRRPWRGGSSRRAGTPEAPRPGSRASCVYASLSDAKAQLAGLDCRRSARARHGRASGVTLRKLDVCGLQLALAAGRRLWAGENGMICGPSVDAGALWCLRARR